MENDAVLSIRNPKQPTVIPKALTISEVTDLFKAFDSLADDKTRRPGDRWIDLRDRAILMLLYGCGLRISEALELNTDDIARAQETGALTIMGKGNKARQVPFLNTVADAIQQYREACPFAEDPTMQLFPRRTGRSFVPSDDSEAFAGAAGSPEPARRHHATRAAPLLRHPSAG